MVGTEPRDTLLCFCFCSFFAWLLVPDLKDRNVGVMESMGFEGVGVGESKFGLFNEISIKLSLGLLRAHPSTEQK